MIRVLPENLTGKDRVIIFLVVLLSSTLLLIYEHIGDTIFRDLVLGIAASTLAAGGHARYVDRKYGSAQHVES